MPWFVVACPQVQLVPVRFHQHGVWWCLPGPQPDGALHRPGGGGQHLDWGPGHTAGEEEQAHGAGAVCAQQVGTHGSRACRCAVCRLSCTITAAVLYKLSLQISSSSLAKIQQHPSLCTASQMLPLATDQRMAVVA